MGIKLNHLWQLQVQIGIVLIMLLATNLRDSFNVKVYCTRSVLIYFKPKKKNQSCVCPVSNYCYDLYTSMSYNAIFQGYLVYKQFIEYNFLLDTCSYIWQKLFEMSCCLVVQRHWHWRSHDIKTRRRPEINEICYVKKYKHRKTKLDFNYFLLTSAFFKRQINLCVLSFNSCFRGLGRQ